MKFSIGINDFNLYGAVHSIDLKAVEFYPYFNTKTTIDSINKELTFSTNLLIAYVNELLEYGLDLPIPKNFTKYI